MKLPITALVAILICFCSCQKEITGEIIDSTTTGSNTSTGSFTAKINGQAWVADKAAGATFSTTGFGLPRLLNITGLSNGKKSLTITLLDSGVHNYTLPADGSTATALYNGAAYIDSTLPNTFSFASNQAWLTSQPGGTVKVSSIDTAKKTISGTFSFNVYRQMDSLTRTFTEGVFTNIPYTDGTGIPAATTLDTFRVKINGTAFSPFSIMGNAVALTNQISVQSTNQAADKNVSLVFPANITAGTYTLDFFSGTHMGIYIAGSQSYASSAGTLTILEHNKATKRIRANFNFTASLIASSTVAELTEGYFSVVYQ